MKGKYNMNTKGKIDFTKTDNIQFIEKVASEISKEDKNWQWEAREIKQHSLLLWWEYLEDEKQEGFRIEYDEAEEVFSVYDEWDNDITYELEDTLAFAIFFGISTRNRNVKKDTQDEAREDATILTKLENIQNTMIEVKSEMGSYRNEMKEIREYYIRASESLKQLHKRVNRIDKIIDESHPHQYIEE